MAFHNIRLPVDIEQGAIGGPRFETTVHEAVSGHEQRISEWDLQRVEVDISYGIRTVADLDTILNHFNGRRGKAHSFPFKWWKDYVATSQNIGTGDGADATFQLIKTYTDSSNAYTRTIFLPVLNTVVITVAAVARTEGVHYNVNYTTGVVTFTGGNIPSNGQAVVATFEFNLPMRYDDDHLRFRLVTAEIGGVPAIPLIEVIGEV